MEEPEEEGPLTWERGHLQSGLAALDRGPKLSGVQSQHSLEIRLSLGALKISGWLTRLLSSRVCGILTEATVLVPERLSWNPN